MSFSKTYGIVLNRFLKQYKDANNEKERKAVIKSVTAAVKSSQNDEEGEQEALPKNLSIVRLSYLPFLFP